MAEHDLRIGNTASYGPPAQTLDRVYYLENTIDFSVNKMAAADTAIIFNLPAYHCVLHAMCQLTTSEGTTATIEIGTPGDPDGIINEVNLMTVGITSSAHHADEDVIGAVSSTATTIIIDPGHALCTAAIKVGVLIADMTPLSTKLA